MSHLCPKLLSMVDLAPNNITTRPMYSPSFEAKPVEQKMLTWEEFQRKYLSREDAFRYEWVNGLVEKTNRNMELFQIIILTNLRRIFEALRISGTVNGVLEAEIDVFFADKVHRRPDISYFKESQLLEIINNQNSIPEFVIEIISTNDQINKVHKKMKNYRDAKVRVVWHVFPHLKEVHVYSGDYLFDMKVCVGEAICSAVPVLVGFEIKAEDVFKLPV
jgi:Uma2 family endonuclease